MRKNIVFLNGAVISANQKLADSLFPYRLRGKGVFEAMRAYNGRIFALDEHLKRFDKGITFLRLELSVPKKEIKKQIYFLLKANRLPSARIRLVAWEEKGKARILIAALPYEPPARRKYTKGFKAFISKIRINEKSPLANKKSVSHSFLFKAFCEAKKRHCDEALLLNRRGFLCEGSRSNLFYVKDSVLFTPALSCGCLAGVTRAAILEIAWTLKIKCRKISALPEKLFKADEAFLTNSLMEVMPLTFVAGRPIGDGCVGKITTKLLLSYRRRLFRG